jgi:hypothetical protein
MMFAQSVMNHVYPLVDANIKTIKKLEAEAKVKPGATSKVRAVVSKNLYDAGGESDWNATRRRFPRSDKVGVRTYHRS